MIQIRRVVSEEDEKHHGNRLLLSKCQQNDKYIPSMRLIEV